MENIVNYINTLQAPMISAISHVITVLVSLFNVFLIIFFYISNQKQRLEEGKLNWYRKIVLDRNIDTIEAFFSACNQITNDCKGLDRKSINPDFNKNLRKKIGIFTDNKIKISHNFVDLVSIINPSGGQALNKFLEDFQDEFISHIENLEDYTSDELMKVISDQRVEFLEKLYSFETCPYSFHTSWLATLKRLFLKPSQFVRNITQKCFRRYFSKIVEGVSRLPFVKGLLSLYIKTAKMKNLDNKDNSPPL